MRTRWNDSLSPGEGAAGPSTHLQRLTPGVTIEPEVPGELNFLSPPAGGALAEGFQDRLREFQRFERTFEEFISQSAVKTKFEQHTVTGRQVTEDITAVMDDINIASADRKICCLEEREEQRDRLDFVRGQMNHLRDNVRDKIKTLSEDVAAKVTSALSDQTCSLPVLVEEFRGDFSPTHENLQIYKTKLLQHVEERLVGCLSHRCSPSVLRDIRDAQRHMTGNGSVSLCPQTLDDILLSHEEDSVRPLLSPSVQEQLFAPSSCFELTYDLGLAVLCADFQENIEFQFSLGWTALVSRFIGAANAKRALSGCGPRPQEDEMVLSTATGLVSVTSRASMTVLVIAGVVWRSVGWRPVFVSLSLYTLLYLYEKLTWTDSNRERVLKQQVVAHAARRLRAVIPVVSSACSQQVCKEVLATLGRASQRVELREAELEAHVRQLSLRIQRLENIQRRSKAFRNRATELETQLDSFSARYLQGN
ncbi:unnamed protein product [Pleuronectes platessa]|uniref:Fzo/mitofusin HR2 domain-containing protein n=1 Tax=Pleuronectes platessa TaxID=8262 RepID=A0A9N7Z7D0_PLEPL|nr:unnamed protein product [Pleuronectes platessa]